MNAVNVQGPLHWFLAFGLELYLSGFPSFTNYTLDVVAPRIYAVVRGILWWLQLFERRLADCNRSCSRYTLKKGS